MASQRQAQGKRKSFACQSGNSNVHAHSSFIEIGKQPEVRDWSDADSVRAALQIARSGAGRTTAHEPSSATLAILRSFEMKRRGKEGYVVSAPRGVSLVKVCSVRYVLVVVTPPRPEN